MACMPSAPAPAPLPAPAAPAPPVWLPAAPCALQRCLPSPFFGPQWQLGVDCCCLWLDLLLQAAKLVVDVSPSSEQGVFIPAAAA